MKKLIKEQWLAALRSGEYEQNRGQLRTQGKFCVLGVLADLHSKTGYSKWAETETHWKYVDPDGSDTEYFLTPAVLKWSKLKDASPKVKFNGVEGVSIVNLNDGDVYDSKYKAEVPAMSFTELADLIEEQF
jgi:hypothetical protein